ncbi:MAG: hypothetical protein HYV36_00330, partial [Lentisphaerae bacterium]|nr:hypothetical protein [Lentisphaerota bacterium]
MKTWIILAIVYLLATAAAFSGSNLVVNGHFGATNEFLFGWKYNYEDTGNSLLAKNHEYVTVTDEDAREHVLDLRAND